MLSPNGRPPPSSDQLLDRLLQLDRVGVARLLDDGAQAQSPAWVSDALIAPSLVEIGDRWLAGTAALSQVYMAARLCEKWVATRNSGQAPSAARVAVALFEDQHALGKQLVSLALRASGIAVVDLGVGNADSLYERATAAGVSVLMVSVLMLASATRMRGLADRIAAEESPLRLVVGGAPFRFDPTLVNEVGAHEVGQSSAEAVTIARRLLEASCAA